MAAHYCHALGCWNACPPRWLMCRTCWALVPGPLQDEVNRTVGLRGPWVDQSWAPWWRAQARAIAHVANYHEPNQPAHARYVARADAFADRLETTRPKEAIG